MQTLRPWYRAAFIAFMFLWGVIAVSVVWPLLGIFLGRRAGYFHAHIQRHWCLMTCRILGIRMEILGTPSKEARLWIANHISWLDIIAMGSRLPLTFIAKEEVADWPVMGYLARRIGTLFVRRGDVEQTASIAEQMAWQLRQGKRLMLFPEGTTTTGERVLRFHAKLLQPAQLANVPVQAIALEYQGEARSVAPFIGEDDFLPHLLSIFKLERIDLRIHYCQPLPAGLHRDVLAQTTRKQVVAALFPKTENDPLKVGNFEV
ncbi:MAG: lysophospholipid acyltransferase family protein [Methylococcaceae bacterium]|nr:lysophospholipid acyltransferase family protein [Methylococcaceae bacterium]